MDFKDIRFNIFACLFGPCWYAYRRCRGGALMLACLFTLIVSLFGFIPVVGQLLGTLFVLVFNGLYGCQISEKMVEARRAKLEAKGVDDDIIDAKTTPRALSVFLFMLAESALVMITVTLIGIIMGFTAASAMKSIISVILQSGVMQ